MFAILIILGFIFLPTYCMIRAHGMKNGYY